MWRARLEHFVVGAIWSQASVCLQTFPEWSDYVDVDEMKRDFGDGSWSEWSLMLSNLLLQLKANHRRGSGFICSYVTYGFCVIKQLHQVPLSQVLGLSEVHLGFQNQPVSAVCQVVSVFKVFIWPGVLPAEQHCVPPRHHWVLSVHCSL